MNNPSIMIEASLLKEIISNKWLEKVVNQYRQCKNEIERDAFLEENPELVVRMISYAKDKRISIKFEE